MTDFLTSTLPTQLTAADIISFPPIVYTFLTSYIAFLHGMDILDAITNYINGTDPRTMEEIQQALTDLTDFTVRAVERGLSYYHSDFCISIYDYIIRYNNIIDYFHRVDDVFDTIQDFVRELDDNHQDNPRFNERYNLMVHQGDRLRVATNVLIRMLRDSENIIHTHHPNFEFLPKQWFE